MIADTLHRAAGWIVGDDTGLSSKHIWAVMMGVQPSRPYSPADPGDLGRCLRLLDAVPEWKPRIGEMATQSPEWAALVKHWPELEALFLEEAGSLHPPCGTRAPRLYDRMRWIEMRARREATP